MKDLLKKYYEKRIYSNGLPSFDNLSKEQIEGLQKTFGYNLYELEFKFEEAKKKFLKSLHLN